MKQRNKGWFHTPNRDGDRSLEQQMIGLEQLLAEVPGKTVLDLGCAEGLISMTLAKAGANSCHGVEVVDSHVAIGREMVGDLPVTLEVANLNDKTVFVPERGVDIVLMLAVLHKLKNPSAACADFASQAADLCVVRLPPYGAVIRDARSEFVPHDIQAAMESAGFALEKVVEGPLAEWLGYFRRKAVAMPQIQVTETPALPPAPSPASVAPMSMSSFGLTDRPVTQAPPAKTEAIPAKVHADAPPAKAESTFGTDALPAKVIAAAPPAKVQGEVDTSAIPAKASTQAIPAKTAARRVRRAQSEGQEQAGEGEDA